MVGEENQDFNFFYEKESSSKLTRQTKPAYLNIPESAIY